MKEEILTAKEWLEKEGKLFETPLYNSACEYYMEKYANYKNSILEDRIKEFREIYRSHPNISDYKVKEYDKHFNINK